MKFRHSPALSFKVAFVVVAGLLAVGGCGRNSRRDDLSEVKFDASSSIAVDGSIANGTLISPSDESSEIIAAVREQLYYTIGTLNGMAGGAPDMRRTTIVINTVAARADGLFDVGYSAKLFIAWPRELQVPATRTFILPARGDREGLNAFYTAYGAVESGSRLCLDQSAHEVSQSILWYYYRPEQPTCSLMAPSSSQVGSVVRTTVALSISGENTTGKYPEYAKVWEDGRLVVTAIFGKYEDGATSLGDAGISAFRQTYYDLLSRYGMPVATNLPAGTSPDADHDDVRLQFAATPGIVDVHLYLVDGIRNVDTAFRAKYNERTKISDFVSYNGHSGLGANIRALANMGTFVQGQYQIYMVNGCDTFAYVDDALRNAHVAVNPGEGVDRYFDMITNAMPSFFSMNSTANLAVIDGLIGQSLTYRQILFGFDQNQRPSVMGEQDNHWPAPF